MAARPTAPAKSTKKPAAPRRRASSRTRLTPRRQKRGLDAAAMRLDPADPAVRPLVARVEAAGGAAIGAYREPLSGRAILLAALPLDAVEPTPFQRDLSPAHTKRLAMRIEQSGSYLDPLIVVPGDRGRLWTPNGRHRLAAAKVLGMRQITALLCADEALAFRILALNTEKAHNLKDRSLEVIRMARALASRHPRAKESEFADRFEGAEFLTLGIVYEQEPRFAGGAYGPFLRKVDRFGDHTLQAGLRRRQDWAARLLDVDAAVRKIIAQLQKRGFRSPYLRNYVVARINPVRFHKVPRGESKPPMELGAALTRMVVAARKFDIGSVRPGDLALVAAMAGGEE